MQNNDRKKNHFKTTVTLQTLRIVSEIGSLLDEWHQDEYL